MVAIRFMSSRNLSRPSCHGRAATATVPGRRKFSDLVQVGALAFGNLLLLSYIEQRESDHAAPFARQHRCHRQPRDVVGDPLRGPDPEKRKAVSGKIMPKTKEATAHRRKDKAGIDAGLVLLCGPISPAGASIKTRRADAPS